MTILWASLACLCLLGAEGFSHPRSLIRPRSRALGIPVGNAVAGTAARVGSSALQAFHSAIGVDSDLHAAVKQAVDAAAQDVADPTVVAFFVSSIYDGAFPYSLIFDYIKQHLPSVKYVLGCTTGCPIATGPLNEPVEVEARSSISVLMGRTAGEGIEASLFNLSPEQMKAYITQEQGQSLGALSGVSKAEGGVALILATESSKRNLAAFLTILEEREGIKGVGGVASSVTSLHQPKVFYSVAGVGTGAGSWEGGFERLSHGLAGLMLTGDIAVQTVVARSCLPVGPMFQVTKTDKNEVLEMKKYVPGLGLEELADTSDGQLSPLVHLDNVLKALPGEQAFSLKKELLVGAVPRTAAEVAEEGYLNILKCGDFYGQKPTAFDAMSGGITLSSMPKKPSQQDGVGSTFQFCIRDTPTARQDLELATVALEGKLKSEAEAGRAPLALLMLGSMERGNRVFRYKNWESAQLYQTLQETGLDSQVPIAGFYSAGAFTSKIPVSGKAVAAAAVMEADSIYALITRKSSNANSATPSTASSASAPAPAFTGADARVGVSDVMTVREKKVYCDEADMVLVTKRDPESTNPVRVGTMDYFVPEKIGQPANLLESVVWDREKDVDRMRERFQLARALSQAKNAEGKFPRRDLFKAIRDHQGEGKTPPVLLELLRNSVNNGRYSEGTTFEAAGSVVVGSETYSTYLEQTAKAIGELSQVVALGTHVDFVTFKGAFEDLTVLNRATDMPIFCDDFVVYVFQLLQAKITGATSVKLMASVLPTKEIAYMLKIAKAVFLTCVVVVSSKPQMLEVLALEGVEAVSVTSRNMRLWKIDQGKAERILADPEVQSALATKRAQASAAGQEFLLMQEGFTHPSELVTAKQNGIDAVFLGEELLPVNDQDVGEVVKKWLQG